MTHPPDPHYSDSTVTLHHGDCLDILRELPDASVDAVCTDPPYNLTAGKKGGTGVASVNLESPYGRSRIGTGNGSGGFMGKAWDDYDDFPGGFYGWCEAWARECLRVLKPGGHMLAFGGTRTWHRLACAVEDAGFEIRDSIAWMYGSGFPKSLDVSKAIDKAAGAEREVVRIDASEVRNPKATGGGRDGTEGATRPWIEAAMANGYHEKASDEPVTDAARTWQGWGTALKPAFEPIVVARKPLAGTVAQTVLAHGTGALNIDGCRTAHANAADLAESMGKNRHADFGSGPRDNKVYGADNRDRGEGGNYDGTKGRWPANVVLDESQAAVLDEMSGESQSRIGKPRGADSGDGWGMTATGAEYDDLGGASRFYYVAKADASERVRVNGTAHPTVKPLALMRWLVRLVTPPGGTVLEPFAGSGTTVEACILEGFRCVAIEREADYLPLIRQRIARRRDPVEAVKRAGEDGGLFDLLGEVGA